MKITNIFVILNHNYSKCHFNLYISLKPSLYIFILHYVINTLNLSCLYNIHIFNYRYVLARHTFYAFWLATKLIPLWYDLS